MCVLVCNQSAIYTYAKTLLPHSAIKLNSVNENETQNL